MQTLHLIQTEQAIQHNLPRFEDMSIKDLEPIKDFILYRKPLDFVRTEDDYDAKVQTVLDQYWPGTTDLTVIKKDGDDSHPDAAVYSAMYNGEEVLVKSVDWTPSLESLTED
jgi:hypothetical protein